MRKPGPIWVEVNSELARSPDFVCLKDEVKSAYLLWALQHPDGALPGNERLALAIGKSKAAVFKIVRALQVSGFLTLSPGGKYALAEGWVRKHKTSAARMAKMRGLREGECDVTKTDNVTSHVTPIVTSHSPECNVTSDVTVTSQKEIPLRNPLRKTSTNPANAGSVEGARERAAASGKSLISRDYWPEGAAVPPSWQALARQKRAILGMPEVDVAVVAEKFSLHHSAAQNQPRTWGEWQAQFIKFALDERGKSHVAVGRSSVANTLRDLAEIAFGTSDGAIVVPN